LKDLQSRISSSSAMSFAELNDEEKRILMELIFNKRAISIDNSVLSYALERSSRNLENIINLVQKIDEYSLSKKRNITVPLLKEILES
jgi:DnaA family protein